MFWGKKNVKEKERQDKLAWREQVMVAQNQTGRPGAAPATIDQKSALPDTSYVNLFKFGPFDKWEQAFEPEEFKRRQDEAKAKADGPKQPSWTDRQKEKIVDSLLERIMWPVREGLLKMFLEGVAQSLAVAEEKFAVEHAANSALPPRSHTDDSLVASEDESSAKAQPEPASTAPAVATSAELLGGLRRVKSEGPKPEELERMNKSAIAGAMANVVNSLSGVFLSYRFELNVAGSYRPCEVATKEPKAKRFIYFRQLAADELLQGLRLFLEAVASQADDVKEKGLSLSDEDVEKVATELQDMIQTALQEQAEQLEGLMKTTYIFQMLSAGESEMAQSAIALRDFLQTQVKSKLSVILREIPLAVGTMVKGHAKDLIALEDILESSNNLDEEEKYVQLRQKLLDQVADLYKELDENVTKYLEAILTLIKSFMVDVNSSDAGTETAKKK